MEESLLRNEGWKEKIDRNNDSSSSSTSSLTASSKWEKFIEEVKKISYIGGPMMAVNLSQYFLQIMSVMMVGHLGELYLSSAAISISFGAVTGFSPLFGMSSALETLCGQAYGARDYRKFGIQIYTGIFSLVLVCIPISVLWVFMEKLLVILGQDPEISHEAGRFLTCLIPALFGYATLQSLVRYFQMQSLVVPMLVSSCVTLVFHIIVCWVLVFMSGLKNLGAAVAISLSYWLNAFLLGLYMMLSSSCQSIRGRGVVSIELLIQGMREFYSFAIPSAAMICLEWWSFELLTVLSGLLPNPKLETSVLSTCLSVSTTLYTIPDGLGAAASTRISNELGAGNPQAARLTLSALASITLLEMAIVSLSLFGGRNVFGYIISNEEEVVEYVSSMAPLVCLCVILDSLHGVLSGIARGSGWQDIGSYINLGAYYLCGIPIAAILGFWTHLRAKGLWIGIQLGSFVQVVLMIVVTACTNWEKQAIKARGRILREDLVVG